MFKVMSLDEKIGMSTFYSGQEVMPKPVSDPARVKRGGELYESKCEVEVKAMPDTDIAAIVAYVSSMK